MNTCSKCPAEWTGYNRCHCGDGCHRTFGGLGGFTAHRSRGKCLDPGTLGMQENAQGVWVTSVLEE